MASEETAIGYVLTSYQGKGLPPDRSDFEDKVKAEKAFADAKFYSILWQSRPPTLGLGWIKLKEKEAPLPAPPAPAKPAAAAPPKVAAAPPAASAPKPAPAAKVTPSPVVEGSGKAEVAPALGPGVAPAAPPSAVVTEVAEVTQPAVPKP